MAKKKPKNFDGPVETIEEFLARGGKITYCKPGARTQEEDISYTWKPKRGRKKKEETLPIDVDESED
jgi:hypothetical protein